jgi:hypothetical protein
MLEPKAVTPAKKFKLPTPLMGALLGGALTGPFSNLAVILGASGGFVTGKIAEKIKQKRLKQREESFKTINLIKPKINNPENLQKRFNKTRMWAKRVFGKSREIKSSKPFESEFAKNHVKRF